VKVHTSSKQCARDKSGLIPKDTLHHKGIGIKELQEDRKRCKTLFFLGIKRFRKQSSCHFGSWGKAEKIIAHDQSSCMSQSFDETASKLFLPVPAENSTIRAIHFIHYSCTHILKVYFYSNIWYNSNVTCFDFLRLKQLCLQDGSDATTINMPVLRPNNSP